MAFLGMQLNQLNNQTRINDIQNRMIEIGYEKNETNQRLSQAMDKRNNLLNDNESKLDTEKKNKIERDFDILRQEIKMQEDRLNSEQNRLETEYKYIQQQNEAWKNRKDQNLKDSFKY